MIHFFSQSTYTRIKRTAAISRITAPLLPEPSDFPGRSGSGSGSRLGAKLLPRIEREKLEPYGAGSRTALTRGVSCSMSFQNCI